MRGQLISLGIRLVRAVRGTLCKVQGQHQRRFFQILTTGRRVDIEEVNGVWHAYECNMPTQSLNTENQLYAVIDSNV